MPTLQDAGFCVWVVYAHHMTERAASFLVKHSSLVDVYRLPGLHLDTYPQIVVVARARPIERGEDVGTEVLKLVDACKHPDSLPPLKAVEEPVYRIPPAAPIKRFYFHPDEITPDLMLPAIQSGGAQRGHTFQAVVDVTPPAPPLAPIVPPRGGQLGLILAAGLFNGLLLDIEDSQAAVRGVVRMAEINTTPPGLVGIKETIEHRAQVTITLLDRSGKVTVIESHEKDRLVSFLKAHRQAFLDYLTRHSKPLYTFDYSRYTPVFDRVFRNRPLPGRPVTGLFETQRHVVGAMLAALEKRRKVLLVGDMGCGKGPMGATVIAALWNEKKFKPGQVAVVLAPPHLVEKWKIELVDVIPGCLPHIADKDPATGGTLVDDVTAFMRRADANPDRLHVLVLSRERAKLGEGWQPAYQVHTRHVAQWPKPGLVPRHFLDANEKLLDGVTRIISEEIPICPTCATPITSAQSGEGKTEPLRWVKTRPRRCHACGGALWQLARTFSAPKPGEKSPKRDPRYPIASLIRERYANRVAVLICDEAHEYKSSASDQGRAMQDLVLVADYAIGMTGTLLGGTASSVFWLEWAFNNKRMVTDYPLGEGIEPAINRWVRSMGVMVKTIEYKQDKQSGVYSGTDRHEHKPEEAPGISPLLIRELVDHTIWVGLHDLAFSLPEYTEIPLPVSLPPDVQNHYDHERTKLLDYLLACRDEGDASFLGGYLQATLRYPSTCYEARPVIHRRRRRDGDRGIISQVVTTLQGFGKEQVFPKEQALIDLLKEELAAGRPCVVFIAQSGKVGIQGRLVELINQHVPGAQPVVLESDTVATDKRDGWLKKQVEKRSNILICNPQLVATGLDLLAFKSLIFFEVHYSLYTISQASRRHWRIGQTDECKVYFIFYERTMEAQAIELVSQKQAAAALLGGDADGGGLAQLSGGAASLEAELARSIAADDAVVDVSKLFRQTARASADFTSGWATGQAGEASSIVVPLQNLIGKRFYHAGQAHQVADYGPLDQAAYQVKNLVSGATRLLDATLVEKAAGIPDNAPLTILQPAAARRADKAAPARQAPSLPPASYRHDTISPLHRQYLAIKQKHPNTIVFFQLGDFYETFDADAETVARELDIVLTSRSIGKGQRVPMAGVPHHAADATITRLTARGHPVAVCKPGAGKSVDTATPTAQPAGHTLPATLEQAYARFRQAQQRNILTFVEMPDAFVSFEGDAVTASQRLYQPAGVTHLPGGPNLKTLTLKRGEHEAAIRRLLKARCSVALANGRIEVLHPEPDPAAPSPKLAPLPNRSPEQLRAMSQGQLALL